VPTTSVRAARWWARRYRAFAHPTATAMYKPYHLIGPAHRLKLKHDVAHSEIVRWSDVEFDANNETVKTRKAMEAAFRAEH
jgi:predicted homoserine dehydrogenase-like protein